MQRELWIGVAVLLGIVMCVTVVQAAEPFDFTSCRSATIDVLAKTDEANVRSHVWNGIDISNHENKLFDNWTHRCMGVAADVRGKRIRHGFCKYMDPDGDFMLLEWPGAESKPFTWYFLAGTGKWKGITGGGDYKISQRGKPIQQGTFQFCIRVTVTYELPK